MQSTAETWKPVVGWEDYYQVSDHGRIRSFDRTITEKTGKSYLKKGRVLRPAPKAPYGHMKLVLSVEGKQKTVYVHRLVLEAFVGPAPAGMECCHNNGNPLDNHLSNLRWDTSKENKLDQVRMGTHENTRKTHCPRGHELAEPNLVAHYLKKGLRTCISCARTRAHLQRNPHLKPHFQIISDQYYAELVKEPA